MREVSRSHEGKVICKVYGSKVIPSSEYRDLHGQEVS